MLKNYIITDKKAHCPECRSDLKAVRYPSDSVLNKDQWEDQIAGNWYCDECEDDSTSSGRKYFWNINTAIWDNNIDMDKLDLSKQLIIALDKLTALRDQLTEAQEELNYVHQTNNELVKRLITMGSTSVDGRQPLQPMYVDKHEVIRFKENAIVNYLLDNGPFDMNHLAMTDFPREDRMQFAQMIGYSVSGWGDLSYVDSATCSITDALAEELWNSEDRDDG